MLQPRCVATTQQRPEGNHAVNGDGSEKPTSDCYFKGVQWSADGTSLIASLADNSIQTFIVPPNLLDDATDAQGLSPYCTIKSAEPVSAVTGYPYFNLEDPSTTLVLSSMRDHPIRLNSALTGHLGASYPLVNPMTEEYISPHSLLFNNDGNRFIAGSESLISIFDVSQPGREPLMSVPTGPKRRNMSDYSQAINMRGIVSALAIDAASGILAVGTYSRGIGLYESIGQGDCIGVFSVKGTAADEQIGGTGITQVAWSPCGRYLYIAERKSKGVAFYDIRKTGALLGWLEGRVAETNQRLGVSVVATDDQASHEVWAGGLDGFVRVWKNPHQSEGSVLPTSKFEAHGDAVSSVVIHRGGGVVATSSGQRRLGFRDEEAPAQAVEVDYSVKIWEL